MKIAFSGLTGPVLNFANAVSSAFDKLASVPSKVVATTDALPPALPNDARRYLIRDIGGGVKGEATSLGGEWHVRSLT